MIKRLFYLIAAAAIIISLQQNALCSFPDSNIRTINVGSGPTSCVKALDFLFVANSLEDTVSVIDLSTYNVVETVTVGNNPQHIVAYGSNVYVSNYDDDSISIISASTHAVTYTINSVGNGPAGMALTSAGDKLFVACTEGDTVAVISTLTNSKTDEIVLVGNAPNYVALSSSEAYLYVTLIEEDAVSILNLTLNEATTTKILVGDAPAGITLTPDGSYFYVANSGSDTISVISAASNSVSKTITTNVGDGVREIAIQSSGSYAFTTNSNTSNVSVINIFNNDTVEDTLTTGTNPYGIFISDDSEFIFVTNKGSNTVTVFEDQTAIIIDEVSDARINDSGTSTISWHSTISGTFRIELATDATGATATTIITGNVTAFDQNEFDIVAATHLLDGDDSYIITIYIATSGDIEYSNTTTITLDNVAPGTPSGLGAEFGDMRIFISWDQNTESDLGGYKIYYGTASGAYDHTADVGTRGSYTLEGLANGVTYYIAVSAVDLAENESGLSAEVSATPDNIYSLSNLKGEDGCFIATASFEKNESKIMKMFRDALDLIKINTGK